MNFDMDYKQAVQIFRDINSTSHTSIEKRIAIKTVLQRKETSAYTKAHAVAVLRWLQGIRIREGSQDGRT